MEGYVDANVDAIVYMAAGASSSALPHREERLDVQTPEGIRKVHV